MAPRLTAALGALLLVGGCATTVVPAAEPHPQDPFEAVNRRTFAFNERLDRRIVKPVAQAYEKAVPSPVREAVANFFGNLGDAWSAVNWLLQGEVQRGLEQGARFAWNTTLGLGGLIDVGSRMGLDKHSQDFGQTLGAWGIGLGPYIVLPALGPSSLRDTAALPLNRYATSNLVFTDDGARNVSSLLEIISLRAGLLGAEKVVEGIALDRYTFFRDAYLQRRGAKARKAEDDEGFEVLSPAAPAASKPN